MPATLVATPDLANVPPRVRLDVTLPAGAVGTSVYITRLDPDGRSQPVRLADPAVVTGSAWVGYDYEAPFGPAVTYSASVVYLPSGSRANLIPNPSFEVGTSGWLRDSSNPPVVRDTAQAWTGAASARIDSTSASLMSMITVPYLHVNASTTHTVSAYVKGTGSAQITLTTTLGATVASSSVVTLTSSWQRITATGTTPAGTTTAYVEVFPRTGGTNSMWVDGIMLEEAASVGAYFDGATTDTGLLNYDWAGTPNNSTSTEHPPGAGVTDTPTATTTLAVTAVWLIHPGVPAISMLLADVQGLGERGRAVNRGVFQPFGRATPIVVTDMRRKAVQAALIVRTRTLDERDALVALTDDAATLLLNIPASLGWGVGAEYISLGDLTEAREVDIPDHEFRLMSAPYLIVSRPIGGSQSQRTWADVLAEAATWQDLMDTRATWLEVLAPTS